MLITKSDVNILTQLYGIVVIGIFTIIVSGFIWFAFDKIMGIHVSEEDELIGLVNSELGME